MKWLTILTATAMAACGSDGVDVDVRELPRGAECPAGGVEISAGDDTHVVCAGEAGRAHRCQGPKDVPIGGPVMALVHWFPLVPDWFPEPLTRLVPGSHPLGGEPGNRSADPVGRGPVGARGEAGQDGSDGADGADGFVIVETVACDSVAALQSGPSPSNPTDDGSYWDFPASDCDVF